MRFILFLVLPSFAGISGINQYIGQPDWWIDPPQGYEHYFVIGSGYKSDIDSARVEAQRDAVRQLVEEHGIDVGASQSDYHQDNAQHSVNTSLSWSTKSVHLDSLRIVDESGDVGYGGIYQLHVLVRYPRPSGMKRSPPPRVLLSASELLIPGSGHIMVGISSRGKTILWYSMAAALISGGSYIAADQARDMGKDPRLFHRTSIISGGIYILMGIMGAFDISSSRYIESYN